MYTVEQARRYLTYWKILRDQRRPGLYRAAEVASGYLSGLSSTEADVLRSEYGFQQGSPDV